MEEELKIKNFQFARKLSQTKYLTDDVFKDIFYDLLSLITENLTSLLTIQEELFKNIDTIETVVKLTAFNTFKKLSLNVKA